MTPIHTTFVRDAMPTNLLTVPEWVRFARATYRLSSWALAAKRYAAENGGALVWCADDTLVVFTKRGDKVSRSTYKPGTWSWEKKDSAS